MQDGREDFGEAGDRHGIPAFEAQIESLKDMVRDLGSEVDSLRRERDHWKSRAERSQRPTIWQRLAG